MIKPTTREVAEVLSKLMNDRQMADLMNTLLGCEAVDILTDREAEIGGRIFDQLVCLRPEAVEIAQGAV